MAARIVKSPAERFWTRVDRRGDGECWPWTGSTRGKGYGAFSVKVGEAPRCRRQIDAHRFSYELHVGPIPSGLLVCHHCDNPPCVNPRHLFVGSYRDNNADKTAKGRNPGNRTENGRKVHALQGDMLVDAMAMVMAGRTQRSVAETFGMSPAAVCRGLQVGRLDERNYHLARERIGMWLELADEPTIVDVATGGLL